MSFGSRQTWILAPDPLCANQYTKVTCSNTWNLVFLFMKLVVTWSTPTSYHRLLKRLQWANLHRARHRVWYTDVAVWSTLLVKHPAETVPCRAVDCFQRWTLSHPRSFSEDARHPNNMAMPCLFNIPPHKAFPKNFLNSLLIR